jgi:hypothetical protein
MLLLCRFMRFMERYAEEHDLGFTKKQVGIQLDGMLGTVCVCMHSAACLI